jgi:hypothetical protein
LVFGGYVATYAIPARYRPGFERLARITEAQFRRLAEIASDVPPSPDVAGLLDRATASGVDGAESILESTLAAASYAAGQRIDASELVIALDAEPLGITARLVAVLRRRLAALLAIEGVWLSARALDLTGTEPRLLIGARIITDLRPVFDPGEPESSLTPTAGMVMHHLVLETFEAGDHSLWTIALDADDLITLRRAIDRAEQKAESLKALMGGNKMVDVTRRARDD